MAENFQNFYVTKLREACDAVATTIYVDTVPAITEGTLVLEYANSTKHEIIHFTGVSGYGLTGCTRGMEGTTAQSHSAGVDVRQNLTAGMIDKIINGVITTENIANSAVTTAKINDGAVTADKIDFTTLPSEIKKSSIAWQTIPSGGKKIDSITITKTGKYLVLAICYFDSSSGGVGIEIRKGSSVIASSNSSHTGYFTLVTYTFSDLAGGDVLDFYGTGNGRVAGIADKTNIAVIRIG